MQDVVPVRLVCFPYAGSSAAVYRRWRRSMPAWMDVCPVDMPGHGRRFDEPLETSVEGMVERCLPLVLPQLAQPYVLFGHSLGAIVAFELAHRLQELGMHSPVLLVASGTDAPSRRDHQRHAGIDSPEALSAELRRLGGTPPEVLADSELLALTLPIVRADFDACARYESSPERKLTCPIDVLGGQQDSTTRESLLAWGEHTTAEFALHMLPGGHFFIHEEEPQVLRYLQMRVSTLLPGAAGVRGARAARGAEPVLESTALSAPGMDAEKSTGAWS
jgi:surfactin synthase thioesterase subunit